MKKIKQHSFFRVLQIITKMLKLLNTISTFIVLKAYKNLIGSYLLSKLQK